jgi:hypothetical protein
MTRVQKSIGMLDRAGEDERAGAGAAGGTAKIEGWAKRVSRPSAKARAGKTVLTDQQRAKKYRQQKALRADKALRASARGSVTSPQQVTAGALTAVAGASTASIQRGARKSGRAAQRAHAAGEQTPDGRRRRRSRRRSR